MLFPNFKYIFAFITFKTCINGIPFLSNIIIAIGINIANIYFIIVKNGPNSIFLSTSTKFNDIPIVSIKKEHQGKGLSKHMLKKSVEKLIEWAESGERPITEVNTTTETNNFQALKMYRHLGFKEDYNYPQSYLPIKK